MKKQILALAAAVAVVASAAVSVSAGNVDTEVWKGTPIIDGKLDDNYKKSATYSMNYEDNVGWSFGTKESDQDAAITTYFLHDDDYFYVYHQVTDRKITTPTDETIFTEQAKHYCKIDEVEIIFTDATGTKNLTKVLVDGNGNMVQLYSMQTAGFPLAAVAIDKAPEYATVVPSVKGYLNRDYGDMSTISPVKAAYTKTDVGYDVELAIPVTDELLASGFGIVIQLSDVDDETGMENGQFLQPKDTLIIKYADKDAGNTEVKADTTKDTTTSSTTTTTTTTTTTSSPATSDATALVCLSLLSAGAAVVATAKSKRK